MKKLLLFILTPFIINAQTLTVSSDITLTTGNYGVVEVKNGAKITIDGDVTFGNINPLNSSSVSITTTTKGVLHLTSSLNMNGNYTFTNNGKLYSSNVEMQNGTTVFNNYGEHIVSGDIQITSLGSKYSNCGTLKVSNFTNIHQGYYSACNCGILETNGLNVNSANHVSGKGSIKVTGNLNLNNSLTTDNTILFCYNGNINQPQNLGASIRTCDNTCTPTPLNLKYSDLKVTKVDNKKYALTFRVLENTSVKEARLKFSTDAKNWTVIKVIQSKEFLVGKVYKAEFSIFN